VEQVHLPLRRHGLPFINFYKQALKNSKAFTLPLFLATSIALYLVFYVAHALAFLALKEIGEICHKYVGKDQPAILNLMI
jgi:hypothetical protein